MQLALILCRCSGIVKFRCSNMDSHTDKHNLLRVFARDFKCCALKNLYYQPPPLSFSEFSIFIGFPGTIILHLGFHLLQGQYLILDQSYYVAVGFKIFSDLPQ